MAVVIGEACQVQILVLSDHGYFKSSLTVGVFVGLLSSCKSKKWQCCLWLPDQVCCCVECHFLLSLVAPGDCHCWSCVEFDCCLNSKKMTTSTMCSTWTWTCVGIPNQQRASWIYIQRIPRWSWSESVWNHVCWALQVWKFLKLPEFKLALFEHL